MLIHSRCPVEHLSILEFYDAADSLDASRYIKGFFTPNAELTLGQSPTMHGHDELLPTITGYLTVFNMMKHVYVSAQAYSYKVLTFPLSGSLGHFDVLPDKIYQQANIHYLVKGDVEKEEIVVKALAVFHKGVEDEKVHK